MTIARTFADDLRISFHEASHLTVSILFGGKPVIASVIPDDADESWGRVRTKPPLDATQRVALYCAGAVGESLALGKFSASGCHRDMQQIAETIGEDFPRDEFRRGIQLAMRLLKHNWPLVKRVAKILREEREIEWPKIARIFHTTPRLRRMQNAN